MFAHSLHHWANNNQALYNGLSKCVAHSVYPYPAETNRNDPMAFLELGHRLRRCPTLKQQSAGYVLFELKKYARYL